MLKHLGLMTMTNKDKVTIITSFLDELFPNAGCELNYHKDYELVIAVMLSAQTTDKSVNKVTDVLFSKYKNLDELNNASIIDIENIIKSIGLYQNKAKNLKGIVSDLINRFHYVVPSDKEELMSLPGVGNKTAGVIRAELFKIPELPVDTHVQRIAKRLNLAKEKDDPLEVERKLKKLFPKERWIKTHHQLIHFGRYFCLAKKPNCKSCKLKEICKN